MDTDDEWKEARASAGRFDASVAALRTYGFGLVTSLITLGAFLSTKTGLTLPGQGKLAAVIAIIALITAAFGLDRYYVSLTMGAVERALDLEQSCDRNRPPALTGNITRYALSSLSSYAVLFLYLAFLAAAVGLGFAALGTDTSFDLGRFQQVNWPLGQKPRPLPAEQPLDWWFAGAVAASVIATFAALWYSAIKLTANPPPFPPLPAHPLRRERFKRWWRAHVWMELGFCRDVAPNAVDRDTDGQKAWLWATGVAALVATGSAVGESVTGSHLLRMIVLAGLFAFEALIGYFCFTAGRGNLLAFRRTKWCDDEVKLRVDPVVGYELVCGQPRFHLTGIRFGDHQTTLSLWLDNKPLSQKLVVGWKPGKVDQAGLVVEPGHVDFLLPRRDPRADNACWAAGPALIQLRFGQIVMGSARLTLTAQEARQLNEQLSEDLPA